MHYACLNLMVKHEALTYYAKAIGKLEWEEAMDDEMDALIHNNTRDLVALPK